MANALQSAYQDRAKKQLQERKRGPLLGRMGSGKTKILLDACFEDPEYTGDDQPILVLCGGNSIPTWKREPNKWWDVDPEDIVVARGSPGFRRTIWKNPTRYKVIITTYGTLLKDHPQIVAAASSWFAIIADEAHKWRNKKSKTFKIMKGVARACERFYPATGTPYRKGPQNVFTMLQLCYPRIFKSYWKFINSFCMLENNGYGNAILGPRNVQNFVKMLNRYAAVLPDAEVEEALPRGTRIPIEVEMTSTQQRLYDELTNEMIANVAESGNIVVSGTILSQITKLRQLLVCPKLWDPSIEDYGAGIDVIVDRMKEAEDSHAIIYVPFTQAIPYLIEYLRDKCGYESLGVLQGQISAEEQSRVIAEFEATRGIILCSVAYAESYSLPTCSQAYFLGPDWSFDVNEQAEGRIRRRDSVGRDVYWYYLKHLGTIEETLVMASMNANYSNVNRVLRTSQEFQKLIKGTT